MTEWTTSGQFTYFQKNVQMMLSHGNQWYLKSLSHEFHLFFFWKCTLWADLDCYDTWYLLICDDSLHVDKPKFVCSLKQEWPGKYAFIKPSAALTERKQDQHLSTFISLALCCFKLEHQNHMLPLMREWNTCFCFFVCFFVCISFIYLFFYL